MGNHIASFAKTYLLIYCQLIFLLTSKSLYAFELSLPDIEMEDSEAKSANKKLVNPETISNALETYEKLSTNPAINQQELAFNKGLGFLKSKNPEAARLEFQKSLRNEKLHLKSLLGIGESSVELKDYASAVDAYRSALLLNSSREDIRAALQNALKLKKQNPQQNKKNNKPKKQKKKQQKDKNKEQQKKDQDQNKQDQNKDKDEKNKQQKENQDKSEENKQQNEEQQQQQQQQQKKEQKEEEKQENKSSQDEENKEKQDSKEAEQSPQEQKKQKDDKKKSEDKRSRQSKAIENALKNKDKKPMMFHLLKQQKKSSNRNVEKDW